MQLTLASLEKVISADPTLKGGFVVDTNVIFAISYPLDHHNEWAEEVIRILHRNDVAVFTNLNIRSEFIDLTRRILIAEGLVDFYEDLKGILKGEVEASLKSLKTRKTKAH
jgi:predicted nucleic acid-binding protein